MLVCDLDGTLINSYNSHGTLITSYASPPSITTIKLLKSISKKGVKLVLSSGRSYDFLSGFSRALGLDPIIISGDGSLINDHKKKIKLVRKRKTPNPIRKKLLEKFPKLKVSYWGHGDGLRIDLDKITKKEKTQIINFVKSTVIKIKYKGLIIVYSDLIDVGNQDSDKGVALEKLKSLHNIKKDEVIAIGDYKNDIPMIPKVGTFIFIGNKTKHKQKHIKRFNNIEKALHYINTLC